MSNSQNALQRLLLSPAVEGIVRPFHEGFITEIDSAAYDADLEGIGSTPSGSRAVSYLPVPEPPTTLARRRYLGHLCSIYIPSGARGFFMPRNAAIIGLKVQEDPEEEATVYDFEQQSVFWRFRDGNITWYLRYFPGSGPQKSLRESKLFPGEPNFSGDYNTSDTAWLANEWDPLAVPDPIYIPPNGGEPPGRPYLNAPDVHDLRWSPWTQTLSHWTDWFSAVGPCRIGLYVSVRQTNPARTVPQSTAVPQRPEDIFVRNNPGLVRYTGVAGMLFNKVVRFP